MKPISLTLSDQTLLVTLPGTGELSHTIKLEGEENWPRLFAILKRQHGNDKIAEPGAPTQHQVDKSILQDIVMKSSKSPTIRYVNKTKLVATVDQRSKIDEILREMGLA